MERYRWDVPFKCGHTRTVEYECEGRGCTADHSTYPKGLDCQSCPNCVADLVSSTVDGLKFFPIKDFPAPGRGGVIPMPYVVRAVMVERYLGWSKSYNEWSRVHERGVPEWFRKDAVRVALQCLTAPETADNIGEVFFNKSDDEIGRTLTNNAASEVLGVRRRSMSPARMN